MSNDDIRDELLKEAERRRLEYEDALRQAENLYNQEVVSAGREVVSAVDDAASAVSNAIDEPSSTSTKPAESVGAQGYSSSASSSNPSSSSASGSEGRSEKQSNVASNQSQPGEAGTQSEKQPNGGEVSNSHPNSEPSETPNTDETPGDNQTEPQTGQQEPQNEENGNNANNANNEDNGEEEKEDKEDKKRDKKKEDPEDKEGSEKKEGKEGQEDEKKGGSNPNKPNESTTGEDSKKPNQPSGDQTGKKQPPQTQPNQTPQSQNNGLRKNPNRGSGGVQRNQPNGVNHSDPTSRARRGLSFNGGKKKNGASTSTKKPGSGGGKTGGKGKSGPSFGNGLKNAAGKVGNGLKNIAKKLTRTDKPKGAGKGKSGSQNFLGGLKNVVASMIMRHPLATAVIAIVILIILIVVIDEVEGGDGGRGRGRRACTYELSGVTSTGTVELTNLRVEVINCDGTADNYEVLDTVDFEKYILGVALAEAGPSSPDEAIKAQIIAVRNFTLTRNSGMCPGNPSDCFYGYNESSGIIRMRACTNDQVYWDYTKDCPKVERSGQPTLYCEGVDGSTDIWKQALSEERQEEVEALANEVMGEVLLDENGNVLQLGYQKDETDQFIADANSGKSYTEILETAYGSNNYSSADCTYGGVYDYGDYTLSSENSNILHEPLDEFLEDNGSSLEEFNELIADNVDDAGWGTRAGVVAAAVTLIGELGDNYGVRVPYYWGGGHYDGVVDGALGYWGSTECHTYANNQHYNYCGFDCSGFVPWAIKNGGFKKDVDLAANFKNMPNARKVTLTDKPELQPGDLLESNQHIVLVVGIDEAAGQYICAEAMGNAYGVLFSRRAFNENGYWGVDLEDYYNDPNYIREPIR